MNNHKGAGLTPQSSAAGQTPHPRWPAGRRSSTYCGVSVRTAYKWLRRFLDAGQAGLPLEPFTVHDLRRTGSTLLNEIGFNRDWIRKVPGARGRALLPLGLQQGRVRRAAAPHAAGMGKHGRCVDRRESLCAEADAGRRGGADAERNRVGGRIMVCLEWVSAGLRQVYFFGEKVTLSDRKPASLN